MSGNFIRDFLPGEIHLSEPANYKPLDNRIRRIRLAESAFDSIDDYTCSLPTGPSAGRIYKKNFGWPAHVAENWFVYIVIDAPDGGGQLHVPYTPVFT